MFIVNPKLKILVKISGFTLLALISGLFLILLAPAKIVPPNIYPLAHLKNNNTIHIEAGEGIDVDKLVIKLTINGTKFTDVSIFEGGVKHTIPKGYGENDWTIIYGKTQTTFRHFKSNNWHDNRYSFKLRKINERTECQVIITGPDKWEETLLLHESPL